MEQERKAHVEFTSILGVVESLQLMRETRGFPLTLDLALALAQFVEALVLHDSLYFEHNRSEAWAPFIEYFEHSDLRSRLPKNVLVGHENKTENEQQLENAIRWSCERANDIDGVALDFAVSARNDCYRGIERSDLGVTDEKNKIVSKYEQLVFDLHDSELTDEFTRTKEALDASRTGILGFHVLVRLFQLNAWLFEEYKNIRLQSEDVAEFKYSPTKKLLWFRLGMEWSFYSVPV